LNTALKILQNLRKAPLDSLKKMDSPSLTAAAFYLTDLDKVTNGRSGKAMDNMREFIHQELEGRGVELNFNRMGPGPFSDAKDKKDG
jgi:hypothetical protein